VSRTYLKSPRLFISTLALTAMLLAGCQSTQVKELLAQPGDPLFQDDFSQPGNGWTLTVNDGGIVGYDGGGLRMLVMAAHHDFWSTLGQDFTNVRLEADALKYRGPEENRIGLICRYQNPDNFYFFVYSSDGYYAIGKVKDGQRRLIGQTEMQQTAAIQTGMNLNHLRADCLGQSLSFYINDLPVAIGQDADFSQGDVGLLTGTFDQGGVDVVFDNFVVLKP